MKRFTKCISFLLATLIMLSSIMAISAANIFAADSTISYSFSNSIAGYAQGTITLRAVDGTYWIYWADDTKALAGYREIASFTVSGGQGAFAMPAHTVIPPKATKLIAVKSSSEPSLENCTVAKASAVYSVPANKQLKSDLLYTFGAISDPQLANDSYGSGSYPYDEVHFAAALETLAKRDVDFTVSSGDIVNDQNGNATYAAEYKAYQRLLADSSYEAPIYEANGNHDVGTKWKDDKGNNILYNNNAPFIKATGLNSNKSAISAGKPYFEVTEPTTGDHFIFMALEGGFRTDEGTQFTTAQLDWLEGLLKKYTGDGKNIFIIEHANVEGWGSGDRATAPYYYDLGLVKNNSDVSRFIKLMETYKDCVIITGHTHLELSAQLNYSDNNGTSAVMMHNSAIGGVRKLRNGTIDRSEELGLSEGYIVEVYEDFILFNGTNMYYNEIMPQCSYIISMSTSERGEDETTPSEPEVDNVTVTLKDTTGQGWMSNNASSREIQLIDNDTNTKYTMTSYDGYKSWTAEVPRSVTDITFRRVNITNNEIRNQWDAGERNSSVLYCVLDDAGGGTTVGRGYWDVSVTEPPKPVVTQPVTTSAQVTIPTTVPKESTSVVTEATEPTEEPISTTPESVPTDSTGPDTSEPSATTQTDVPKEDYIYGDADLNDKVNVKDATTVQKYTAKMIALEGVAFAQSDVTGDMKVNIKDATSIQKLVAKIIDKFPVEEIALVAVGATVYTAEQDLEDYYTFSSYDQYMALKKAYRNGAAQSEITSLQNALYNIAGARPSEVSSEITVYFSNTQNWGTVCAYIWGTDGDMATWPGKQMTYVRNNSSGQGVYKVTLDYSKYQNIIFNNNNNNEQTVDIALSGENNVGYYINGGSGKAFTFKQYTYSE